MVIAEHADGKLNAATAKTVSAALALKPIPSTSWCLAPPDPVAVVAEVAQAKAPIFEIADIGLVEDLFKSLPELDSQL